MAFKSEYEAVGMQKGGGNCHCCGRMDLNRIVILRHVETGARKGFGTGCAANALYGKRDRSKVDVTVKIAARAASAERFADLVREMLASGMSPAETCEAANKRSWKEFYVGGCDPRASDCSHWKSVAPRIQVDMNGLGRVINIML